MSYGTCLMMFSRWVSWLPPSDSVQPVGGKPSGKRETSVAHAVFCAVCVVIFCIFFFIIISSAMMKQTVPMSEIISYPLEIRPGHFH